MNGPKVVAQVLVVAIIVGCCYGMFTTAIPTEYPPVEISSNGDATVAQDGMAIKITTPEFTVDSKMPSDLKDVYIDLALDADGLRYSLGRIPIGTITAKDSTTVESTTVTVPAYVALASLACNSKDGQITTPILAKLHFSYLEFQKESFIDLGLNLRINMSIEGGITVEKDGNNATMTINVPSAASFTDVIVSAADSVCTDGKCPITINGCDAKFDLDISSDGKTVKFTAEGTADKSAFEILDSYINDFFKDDSNTEITMNYGGEGKEGTLTITKDQAKSFENMIKAFYGAAA